MLTCENIVSKDILKGISFSAKKGDFTAIVGKNGSGKTTLAKCIMGENACLGKTVLDGMPLRGMDAKTRAKKIAYLPQNLPTPNITVFELVSLGRNPYLSLSKKLSDTDVDIANRAIADVNLSGFENRLIPSLSGGEKQRAFLAMMLCQDAEVLLLDEPTAHMDMSTAKEFISLVSGLGKTLIVIMHDLSLAINHADSILVLDGGKQIFFGSREECLSISVIEETFSLKKTVSGGNILFFA